MDAAPGHSSPQASPSSRTRLVVAAQALEIQHLQDVVRARDAELTELRTRLGDERRRSSEAANASEARSERLESQVQLLATKLREFEAARGAQLGEEVAVMMSMSQTGRERDELATQLREELRQTRSQNAALLQEREIILEKLVAERNNVAALEGRARSGPGTAAASGPGNARGGGAAAATRTASRAVQTSDEVAFVAEGLAEPGERAVDMLRRHIDLEQELLQYHEGCAAVHSANIAELHERLQRRLQQEVQKLQDEQEKYTRLMNAYGGLRANNIQSPAPHAAATPRPLPDDRQQLHRSPPPPPPLPHHHGSQVPTSQTSSGVAASSPFFRQQEAEMAALRQRLVDLQQRHDSGEGEERPSSTHVRAATAAASGRASRTPPPPSTSTPSSVLDRMLASATHSTPRHL